MKSRRWLALGLAVAFLFQASDLTRMVFAEFRLAPTCPVVGFDDSSNTHTNTLGSCCEKSPPESGEPSAPARQPRKTSNECSLCKQLLMAGTALCVDFSERVIETVSETLGRQLPSDRPDSIHAFGLFHGRAPPAVA